MSWFLKKFKSEGATLEHLSYVVLYAPTGRAGCKEYNCKSSGNANIQKGDLKVVLNQSFGTWETIQTAETLGGYHWDCFLKTLKQKYPIPVTAENFTAKEFLEEPDLKKILQEFPQLSRESLYVNLGEEDVNNKKSKSKKTTKTSSSKKRTKALENMKEGENKEEAKKLSKQIDLMDTILKKAKEKKAKEQKLIISDEMKQFDQDFHAGKIRIADDDLVTDSMLPSCVCGKGRLKISTVYPKVVKTGETSLDDGIVVGFEPFVKHPVYGDKVSTPLYCQGCGNFYIECSGCLDPILDWITETSEDEYSCEHCGKIYCQNCFASDCVKLDEISDDVVFGEGSVCKATCVKEYKKQFKPKNL